MTQENNIGNSENVSIKTANEIQHKVAMHRQPLIFDYIDVAPSSYAFDLREYVNRQAAREAKPDAKMTDRMQLHWHLIFKCLDAIRQSGEELDKLKGIVFYNKPSEYLSPQSMPLEGQRQRLDENETIRLLHMLIGKASEVAEMIEAILPYVIEGKEIDKVNLLEEIGDDIFYSAVMCNVLKAHFDSVVEANDVKLFIRLGQEFSQEGAKNRDRDAERIVLERFLEFKT